MKRELVDALQRDYPDFFKDLWGDPRHTCMAFGIETGDGWEPLLRKLCADIKAAGSGGFVFNQIKEKFGTLRAYWSGYGCGRDLCYAIEKAIAAAEKASAKTCEACGEPGVLRGSTSGWLFVACQQCADETRPDSSIIRDEEDGDAPANEA